MLRAGMVCSMIVAFCLNPLWGGGLFPSSESTSEEQIQIELEKSEELQEPEKPKKESAEETLFVTFETTMGEIVCELFPKSAPKTVDNFMGLANGTKEWLDPRTGQKVKKRLYDGLIFHRVLPNFMIQGGDPLGSGRGGPGYRFEDEIDPKIRFDSSGRLAMANSGPNTNGSQFFITVVPTPWLNGKHTIFGQVVEGEEVLKAIVQTPRDARDKPLKPVIMKKVVISQGVKSK